MTIDEAVRQSLDSSRPRVIIKDGQGLFHFRKPQRRKGPRREKGIWCVQFFGFPALVNPHYDGRLLVFDIDYSL